ncbi:PP2C family protein-serine/threonine phosphatase [Streptomyces sp. NPDC058001]|uniref:PP2C family protein-serine/threonine phosphatase n=1 Tax=Streptomyces sp. NPDC058001 TaxID=3346300 RepID=UPI0036EE32FB
MIRIRAGALRTRTRTRATFRARVRAGPLRFLAFPGDPRRLRRGISLGLPTLWGAVAITYKLVCPLAQETGLGARIVTSAVFFAVGTALVVHIRHTLLRELRQMRKIAHAAQNVLLRPLPPRVDGLAVAGGQLSADPGAGVGGDLYEVLTTEHGVRVVMGDVRGHGLGALSTVAAVLGSFREAVHDEAELAGVLRRLERALARHLRERSRAEHPAGGGAEPDSPLAEEFVTLLLLEIRPDGEVVALNCGHPWPYLLSSTPGPRGPRGRVERLDGGEPLPPLGPFPLPADLPLVRCGRLRPGEALVLHTDGVEDARDRRGRFFPLHTALAEAVRVRPVVPQALIHALFAQLLRHAGGLPADDGALLVLANDRRRLVVQQGEPIRQPAQRAT